MGRPAKEPRLWLQPAHYDIRGRLAENATWVILDRGLKKRTGCIETDRAGAEMALTDYLLRKPSKKFYYIYFLTAKRDDFPVKIGITENRFDRFAALQTSLPYEVDLLGILPVTDPVYERRLHKRFSHARLKGEWFERTPELMKMIGDLSDAYGIA